MATRQWTVAAVVAVAAVVLGPTTCLALALGVLAFAFFVGVFLWLALRPTPTLNEPTRDPADPRVPALSEDHHSSSDRFVCLDHHLYLYLHIHLYVYIYRYLCCFCRVCCAGVIITLPSTPCVVCVCVCVCVCVFTLVKMSPRPR